MEIIQLLELLQEMVDSASKVPMSGKIMLNKKEILELIEDILNAMPEEIRKAQWVMDEKQRLLDEAVRESDSYKRENMLVLKEKIENHDIVEEAKERASEIIASAENDAKFLRIGAREYAESILKELDEELQVQKIELLNTIKEKSSTIIGEIEEYMDSSGSTLRKNLKELKKSVPSE